VRAKAPHADCASAPDKPFALVEEMASATRITCPNRAARREAVIAGLNLSEARARCPGLQVAAHDREGEARDLHTLGLWLRRASPSVMVLDATSLALDMTGTERLTGPHDVWAQRLIRRLARDGLTARLALAPTIGAAFTLAHHHHETLCIAEAENLEAALCPMPVEGLRLEEASLRLLHRFGLNTIGLLQTIPRAALERRFHMALSPVLRRRDEALGRREEPFIALEPPAGFFIRLRPAEPLIDQTGITATLAAAADQLCALLKAHGRGARSVRCILHRVDASSQLLAIGCARPLADPCEMVRLFGPELERADPQFGIEAVMLEALRHEAMDREAASLSPVLTGRRLDEEAMARFADRVMARLGVHSARTPAITEHTLPEAAETLVRFQSPLSGTIPHRPRDFATPAPRRPLRLLDPPEAIEVIAELPDGPPRRFRWRHRTRRTVRSEGPERLAPPWWQSDPGLIILPPARDYYVVEDEEAARFWLFREGEYGGDDPSRPRWFIHGLLP
jgi:protein ImuB